MINLENLAEFVNGCIPDGIGESKISLTYEQVKELIERMEELKFNVSKYKALVVACRPFIKDQAGWGNSYENIFLEEIERALDNI